MSHTGTILERTATAEVTRGTTLGTWDVTFESEALPGTLAVFAGVLALSRLDISAAIMRCAAGERVRDTFTVSPLYGTRFSADDSESLAATVTSVLRGQIDLERDLRLARRETDGSLLAVPAHVVVKADSAFTTGINVRAADRLGLLHDIAATLTRHGLRTRAITVLTYGGMAHDSFRVVDGTGSAVNDGEVLDRVRAELLAVCAA